MDYRCKVIIILKARNMCKTNELSGGPLISAVLQYFEMILPLSSRMVTILAAILDFIQY